MDVEGERKNYMVGRPQERKYSRESAREEKERGKRQGSFYPGPPW